METWIQAIHDGYTIWDIGQLPPKVKAGLRAMAKRGEIFEGRGFWAQMGQERFYWRDKP